MSNTLGIPEATMANCEDNTAAINTIGALATNARDEGGNHYKTAVCRVTDHPANDVAETGSDTSKMALFVSRYHLDSWVLGGAKQGSMIKGQDVLIPVTPPA